MAVRYLIFSIFFCLSYCFNQANGEIIYGKAKIIDGDTIHINNNKIRLHAIDAPETNQICIKNSKKWSCGLESTKFLKNLIMVNKFMNNNKFRYWLKRLGFLGFMFFFIKGLVWIAVIYFGLKLF